MMSRKEMNCVSSIDGMRISGLMKTGCGIARDFKEQLRDVDTVTLLYGIG